MQVAGVFAPWSDPVTWPSGRVPVAGERVVITNEMSVNLDVSPPPLGHLIIEGKLRFLNRPLTLSADGIVVFGELQVGNATHPITTNATILLNGVRTSPTVVVDNAYFLGNKVISVFGDASMVGVTRPVTWTKLGVVARAGDTSITLDQAVDWAVGEEVVITGTEYDASQVETAIITARANGGRTLLLNKVLLHTHAAQEVSTSGWQLNGPDVAGGSVRFAAAVGLLTRNVVVRGTDVNAVTPNYGGHIVVGSIVRTSGQSFVGKLNMSYVQLDRCGKQGMEHAALLFSYLTMASSGLAPPRNFITGCSFSNTFNYGVVGERVANLELRQNVFHRTFRTSVDLDSLVRTTPGDPCTLGRLLAHFSWTADVVCVCVCVCRGVWESVCCGVCVAVCVLRCLSRQSSNAIIVGNLVAGTYRSPDETSDWVRPIAAFFINARPAQFTDNVAGSSEDAGMVLIPDACGTANPTIRRNEVHGAGVGVMLLSVAGTCVEAVGLTVWKCAHIGVLTVDQRANVELSQVIVADNHVGISLNFVRGGYGYARVRDSAILGTTPGATTCSQSTQCRAMALGDPRATACNSVFGNTWRRVGIMSTQYTNLGKTCAVSGGLQTCRPPTTPERMCGMPWEKRYGLPLGIDSADLFVEDTVFAHFAATECGQRSAAVAMNPSQVDFHPPMSFSGITYVEVEEAAKFVLGRTATTAGECRGTCDSYAFTMVADVDGSISGTPGSTVLGENAPLALSSPTCASKLEWGGFVCTGVTFRAISVQPRVFTTSKKALGPVRITRFDADAVLTGDDADTSNIFYARTYGSVGAFMDPCPDVVPNGRYRFLVAVGFEHELVFTNSLPARLELRFFSPSPAEAVVMRMFVADPMALDVFVEGTKVPSSGELRPNLTHVAGTNQLHPQSTL